jgi:ZIP family zinc transporter
VAKPAPALEKLDASGHPPSLRTLQIGDAAPDFALPGIDGRTWKLSDFAGPDVLMVPIAEAGLGNSLPAIAAFFGGFLITALIDKLVPNFGNPHEPYLIEDLKENPAFRRTGMPAALAIAAHSFPEGLAIFIAALHAPAPVAIGAAVALALHNIPEGIATALPMYHATGSRTKACGFSSLTGLAEPLGALIVYTLLYRFMSGAALDLLTAAAAGIMVFIALDGLLPAAHVYGKYHHAIYGVVTGMLLAALSGLI